MLFRDLICEPSLFFDCPFVCLFCIVPYEGSLMG